MYYRNNNKETYSQISRKCRIIERVMPDGRIEYVIQQKHFLFWWLWVDAWINCGVECTDSFDTIEKARKNICYFDGTTCKEKVVLQN